MRTATLGGVCKEYRPSSLKGRLLDDRTRVPGYDYPGTRNNLAH